MSDNSFIGWAAFSLFVLAVAVVVLLILFPAIGGSEIFNPEAALWVAGALSLVATAIGFLGFRTPQGKVAAIGGLLLLLAILFVTPLSSQVS